jgi:hypothetical protein
MMDEKSFQAFTQEVPLFAPTASLSTYQEAAMAGTTRLTTTNRTASRKAFVPIQKKTALQLHKHKRPNLATIVVPTRGGFPTVFEHFIMSPPWKAVFMPVRLIASQNRDFAPSRRRAKSLIQ